MKFATTFLKLFVKYVIYVDYFQPDIHKISVLKTLYFAMKHRIATSFILNFTFSTMQG